MVTNNYYDTCIVDGLDDVVAVLVDRLIIFACKSTK
jgi:hypothetical protein